ncbi:hypothetical protein TYRP_016659 [Tyrophagus putrescentiae]|nr:hypothetical protein TYRP_016659 [Tyrophagus putrescentiae]
MGNSTSGAAHPRVRLGAFLTGLQVARPVPKLCIANRRPGTGLTVGVIALEGPEGAQPRERRRLHGPLQHLPGGHKVDVLLAVDGVEEAEEGPLVVGSVEPG